MTEGQHSKDSPPTPDAPFVRPYPALVSVVIPAYNEEGNIALIAEKIAEVLRQGGAYELIFVDDGSTDGTMAQIEAAMAKDPAVVGVSFSRNFGHQCALAAGLRYVKGDVVIMMDADMQHPPSLLPRLIEQWRTGYNVVQTRRIDAEETPVVKRQTSRMFYRVFSKLCGIRIDPGMADFRLLDRAIVAELNEMKEGQLFLRGLLAWMGYRRSVVEFEVGQRHTGQTKYTMRKMLAFAKSGLLSFSPLPLRISIVVGVITAGLSLLELLYALIMYLAGRTMTGWASTIIVMSLMFAVLFLLIGLQGEYILRIYERVQSRPSFLVERVVRKATDKNDEPQNEDDK